jgi:hypothetical protein
MKGLAFPQSRSSESDRSGPLEAAGVEFTNGDQPGVRLTKAAAARPTEPASASKPAAAAKVARRKTAKAHPRRNDKYGAGRAGKPRKSARKALRSNALAHAATGRARHGRHL